MLYKFKAQIFAKKYFESRINTIPILFKIYFIGFFQRGHIYTSFGSFFIEPIEDYTIDNQNILHKISREKLPLEKVQFDKYRNGKILIDETALYDDENERVHESNDEDDENDQNAEEIDINNSEMDETQFNFNSSEENAIIQCDTTDDDGNKSKQNLLKINKKYKSINQILVIDRSSI